MLAQQKDRAIPTDLLPSCPRCGRPLTMNLRSDDTFVQDEGVVPGGGPVCRLPPPARAGPGTLPGAGVGYNTPGIIKYPFWRRTLQNPQATYVCLNAGQAATPRPSPASPSAWTATSGDPIRRPGHPPPERGVTLWSEAPASPSPPTCQVVLKSAPKGNHAAMAFPTPCGILEAEPPRRHAHGDWKHHSRRRAAGGSPRRRWPRRWGSPPRQ